MIDEIRKVCRKLLEDEVVQVIFGYGQVHGAGQPHPVFITTPANIDHLTWSSECHHNLVTYLNRAEVKSLGKAAVVAKACDERALIVLERESQIDREQVYVVGVACGTEHRPQARKCDECETRVPQYADIVVGTVDEILDNQNRRYADLDRFLERTPAQRMEYWQEELQRCTKCYACRQVCPLCYCQQCIVDKNQPICIDPSSTLKGNVAWHITRAFHLAGRCIGCDECTRACPAGIDLRLLNLSLARAAEDGFGYRAGYDRDAEPVVGAYREQDQESFIR